VSRRLVEIEAADQAAIGAENLRQECGQLRCAGQIRDAGPKLQQVAGAVGGPVAVSQTRMRYNEVYRATNDEQLLLNIVRLRYADSPIFIDLANITSQFEVASGGDVPGCRKDSGQQAVLDYFAALGDLPAFWRMDYSAAGERVIAWHVPPRDGQPVAIYFHGNAQVVAARVPQHRELIAGGAGLLALSYRGYMGSTGKPTEQGLLLDAEAVYQFAVSRYSWDRIVLWGHSLGSGVAVALAATRPVAKLILEAPFSSTVDVAASMFPVFPVRWLMRDQFHSDQRIAAVKASTLILHGDRDVVVPIKFGERLFALAPEPKRFVRYPGGGHDDLDAFGAGA
jgi:fermentation-respiration switch protein FrsA (DUF1100 family)